MEHGAGLVRKLLDAGWPEDVLINVNFPDVEPSKVLGIRITEQGRRDQEYLRVEDRLDTRGNPYYWLGFKNRFVPRPQRHGHFGDQIGSDIGNAALSQSDA